MKEVKEEDGALYVTLEDFTEAACATVAHAAFHKAFWRSFRMTLEPWSNTFVIASAMPLSFDSLRYITQFTRSIPFESAILKIRMCFTRWKPWFIHI